MSYLVDDTIAAIATAPGGAMRGVIRLSGPGVVECLTHCFQCNEDLPLHDIHRPSVLPGNLAIPAPLGELPCDLYLWPSQRSYTRQVSAELHTIGSPPLVDAALRAVCAAGARLAEPGEFTLRAFLAGRLDLTQAEAVLGIIDAAGEQQLQLALEQLAGGLSRPLDALRHSLLDLLADLEAGLDFAEEDIEFITADQLRKQLDEAALQVQAIARQMIQRGESTDRPPVVLIGWPNVGKSSLLNALVGCEAAIVSDLAHTTRDYLTWHVTIEGLDYLLVDTAGIHPHEPDNPLDAAAQQMTRRQIQAARVQLLCLDSTRPLNDWEHTELARGPASGRLLVLTKTDAPRATDLGQPAWETSSKTGVGVEQLRAAITTAFSSQHHESGQTITDTARRCRGMLHQAAECLARAGNLATGRSGEELVAAEIRLALELLGKVTGTVCTDDVLDRIFSRFCIGK